MNRIFYTVFILVLLYVGGCNSPGEPQQSASDSLKRQQDLTLERIADINTEDSLFDQLILQLDTIATEPVSFWTGIINDTTYTEYRRRRSVAILVVRHVHPGISLNHMVDTIGKINWIRRENISVPQLSGGNWKLSEEVIGQGRVYKIDLFPELKDGTAYPNIPQRNLHFYLGLPPIDMDSLAKFLQTGDTTMKICRTEILSVQ